MRPLPEPVRDLIGACVRALHDGYLESTNAADVATADCSLGGVRYTVQVAWDEESVRVTMFDEAEPPDQRIFPLWYFGIEAQS